VWTSSGKVAAVGVRATRWVSYHGMALNVAPDLAHFDSIVPCGLADAAVSSVAKHLGLERADEDSAALLTEYSLALQRSFEDVFSVSLMPEQFVWGEPRVSRVRPVHGM